jgi:hypothetical protein
MYGYVIINIKNYLSIRQAAILRHYLQALHEGD